MNSSKNTYTPNLQGERIKSERQRLKLTQPQVADEVGVGKTTVINWEKGDGTSPNGIQMAKLLDLGFNIHYILTGVQMGSSSFKSSGNEHPHAEEFALIPMYDVEVSAGHGAVAYGVSEPVGRLAFRKDWLASRGLYEKDLHVVVARGDSMEPTIHGKDTLLIDTSKSVPRDGHIYVIRSGDALWVKRVQRLFDNSLLLISDNTSYPPVALNLSDHPDINVIGQVVNVSKDLN